MSIFSKLLALLGLDKPAPDSAAKPIGDSPMNEGDFHSGPGGYSAGSGYSNTFYGGGEYLSGGGEEDLFEGGLDEGSYR